MTNKEFFKRVEYKFGNPLCSTDEFYNFVGRLLCERYGLHKDAWIQGELPKQRSLHEQYSLNDSCSHDDYDLCVDNLATDLWGGAGPDCSTMRVAPVIC